MSKEDIKSKVVNYSDILKKDLSAEARPFAPKAKPATTVIQSNKPLTTKPRDVNKIEVKKLNASKQSNPDAYRAFNKSSDSSRPNSNHNSKGSEERWKSKSSDAYLSSEDESDEEISFTHIYEKIDIKCPFKNCTLKETITELTELNPHFKSVHKLYIKDVHYMITNLQKYIDFWKEKVDGLDNEGLEALLTKKEDFYVIDPSQLDFDKKKRLELQQERIKQIIELQNKERETEWNKAYKCLFCVHIQPNRHELLDHMFKIHGFNIGLPDNLVNLTTFLEILEKKLKENRCFYCEKSFATGEVLRRHMRKKKHFKVHAKNYFYDQFYMVNYAQPGKGWEVIELENLQSDDENDATKSWDEWDDTEDETTKSLFDDKAFENPQLTMQYLKTKYQFDLLKIKEQLDLNFYQMVALINYIRFQTRDSKCVTCFLQFDDNLQLQEHYTSSQCLTELPTKDTTIWDLPEHLHPVIENDPLLIYFDSFDDYDNSTETDLALSQKLMYAMLAEMPPIKSEVQPDVPKFFNKQLKNEKVGMEEVGVEVKEVIKEDVKEVEEKAISH